MWRDGFKDRTVRTDKGNKSQAHDREDRNRGQIDAGQDPPHRIAARPEGNEICGDTGEEDRKENDRAKDPNLLVQPIGSVLRRNLKAGRPPAQPGSDNQAYRAREK